MAKETVSIVYRIKDLASKGLKKIGTTADTTRSFLVGFAKGITIASTAAAAIGGVFLKAAGAFEQWQLSFETMLGSAAKAEKLLKDIKEFAAGTPFELPGLIESSKQLLAFGIDAEDIVDTMRSLGDIAAAVGTEKLPTLVNAFGKIKTKGTATMEELNRFLEAGVPILDELAEGYEVSTQELLGMVSQGRIGFDDVNGALKRLTAENSQFGGLMERQSESLFGVFSNIKDNITQINITMGQKLLPTAKKVSKVILKLTEDFRASMFANKEQTEQIAVLDHQLNVLKDTEGSLNDTVENGNALQKVFAKLSLENTKNEIDNIQKRLDALRKSQKEEIELEKELTKEKIAAKEEEVKVDEVLRKQMLANATSTFQELGDTRVSIEQQTLKAVGGFIKKGLFQQIDAFAATHVASATATAIANIIPSFGGSLLVLAGQLTGISAAVATAKTAINAVGLAEGGIVQATPGGTSAVIGEGGSDEAVIPLDSEEGRNLFGGGGQAVMILSDDGRQLATAMYYKQNDLLRSGQLSPRRN